MRASLALLTLTTLLLLFVASSTPISPARTASASHLGPVRCVGGNPVSDGVITPDEYGENYFDETTKILVYLSCDNSTQRILHAGIVSPWSGWTGLMVQASEAWNGVLNEVRVSYAPSLGGLQVMDAYRNVSAAFTAPDPILSGSPNVMNVSTGAADAARVYEFSVPLYSNDNYDSQLQSSGPFYFALGYNASDPDLQSDATTISELQSMVVETGSPGTWTSLEFAIAPASEPLEEPKMLLLLRDEQGYPIPSSQLKVFAYTAFGFLDVGSVVTNDQGVAEVSYVPRDSGSFQVGAAFAGDSGLMASVAWHFLRVAGSSHEGGFEFRPIEALVAVIVTAVWATYGYAFYVTHQALREDSVERSYAKLQARVRK